MKHQQRGRWECHACNKVAFGSSSRAREALDAISQSAGNGRKPVRPYQCPYGNGWHLTSKQDWAVA